MNDFENSRGYEIIYDFILDSVNDEFYASKSLQSLAKLTVMGDSDFDFDMINESDFPFQHDGFLLPKRDESKLRFSDIYIANQFRNFKCLDILYKLYFSNNFKIQQVILNLLNNIISQNKMNYFIISSKSNIFVEIIQSFDSADIVIKPLITCIIENVSILLNFVPFKEMHLLVTALRDTKSSATEAAIIKLFKRIVTSSPKWKRKLNDLGFVSSFSLLFQSYCNFECDSSCNKTVENFDFLVELMVDLLTCYENSVTFNAIIENSLFLMLTKTKSLQYGICKLLISLIVNSHSSENSEFKQLIEMTKVPDNLLIDLKLIIKTISNCFTSARLISELKENELKDVFRESGGFQSMKKCLKFYHTGHFSSTETSEFLKVWTILCIAAIKNHKCNRYHFWKTVENFDLEFNPFIQNQELVGLLCGIALSLAVENPSLIDLEQAYRNKSLQQVEDIFKQEFKIKNFSLIFFVSRFVRVKKKDIILIETMFFYPIYKLITGSKFNQIHLCVNGLFKELLDWIDFFSNNLDMFASVDPKSPISLPGAPNIAKCNAIYGKLKIFL